MMENIETHSRIARQRSRLWSDRHAHCGRHIPGETAKVIAVFQYPQYISRIDRIRQSNRRQSRRRTRQRQPPGLLHYSLEVRLVLQRCSIVASTDLRPLHGTINHLCPAVLSGFQDCQASNSAPLGCDILALRWILEELHLLDRVVG